MPLTPATRQKLKGLYSALREDLPVEHGDKAYVENLNRDDCYDPVAQMASDIDFQEGGGVCLFTGQRGTGKSTELKRLQSVLENEYGCVVLYIDMHEYMLMSKEIEISDFMIMLAGAMSESIERRYGCKPADRGYWERIGAFLQTEIELNEFGGSLAGVDLKASLKSDPDFKLRIQRALRGHLARVIQNAHKFIQDAIQQVRVCESNPTAKVVLIVDSIERMRGSGDEAMRVYDSVRNLFFDHAEHLRIPMLHIVYTVPPYLTVLAPGAGGLMGCAITHRLVSTHVFKDHSRDPDETGLALMREVVARRCADWQSIFMSETLDRLALASGGDVREFFRMIKNLLNTARNDDDLPFAPASAAQIEEMARREMMPISADHLAWLKRIARSHQTCLANDEGLPTLAHFLDNRLVMNYRNGTDWYDVHPLLREVVDAYPADD